MADSKSKTSVGTDWTGLLADPDLAKNFGKLLQIYRDATPEGREQALLAVMREIKRSSAQAPAQSSGQKEVFKPTSSEPAQPVPVETSSTPPFEPDLFGSSWASDRRRAPRIKCFVAVELRVNDADTPVWGNLSNTSRGGCQVETVAHISAGAKVEIGLWVASGKIWVKGVALNGVVTHSVPAGGVRVRFEGLEAAAKENLRQFLKYVQETTRASKNESNYMQLLK
jgi:PilZ domain